MARRIPWAVTLAFGITVAVGASQPSFGEGAPCDPPTTRYYGFHSTQVRVDPRGAASVVTLRSAGSAAWFTDRPVRRAGRLAAGEVGQLLANASRISTVPAIVVIGRGGTLRTTAVDVIRAGWSPLTADLRLEVRALSGGSNPFALAAGDLGAASVILDPAATDPTPAGRACSAAGSGGPVFAVTGPSGTFTPLPNGAATLRMHDGARATALVLDDGSRRKPRALASAQLVALWQGSTDLTADPPNALLLGTGDDGTAVTAEIELSRPRVDGRDLTFDARRLDAGSDVPRRFADAVLFIDAFPTSIDSQITDSVTQANVEVLGDAPADSMSALYTTMSQALALASQSATAGQLADPVPGAVPSASAPSVTSLYSIDATSPGAGAMFLLGPRPPAPPPTS